MSIAPLEKRPTHKALPLLRSEVSRITHRRFYRVLAILLLAAIAAISLIVFFAHSKTEPTPNQRHFDRFERCIESMPPDEEPESFCGPDPASDPYSYGSDDRYLGYENIPISLIGIAIAAAGVAFLVGASSGGAEWSSRSMTLQLLYEPRRLRLLTIKWLGLLIAVGALALIAMIVTVAFAAITTSLRGTWDERYAPVDELKDHFWSTLAIMGLRGLLLVAIAATIGYAIAMLVRNTGASLGVGFVYFVVVENGVRIALMKYGTEPFMLSTTAISSLFPGGLEVPGAHSERGFSEDVKLTNLRASVTMLTYAALISIPAAWSFTRRDVS